jgi:hypothetical protein
VRLIARDRLRGLEKQRPRVDAQDVRKLGFVHCPAEVGCRDAKGGAGHLHDRSDVRTPIGPEEEVEPDHTFPADRGRFDVETSRQRRK